MKIRNGFVSNSSSSSFTCDVCANTESGMDMCLSDVDMKRCFRDHTFCNSHSITGIKPTLEQMRESLKLSEVKSWRKPDEIVVRQAKYDTMPEDELRTTFEEMDADESLGYSCPLCQLETLSDSDVCAYAFIKLGYNGYKEMAADVKKTFGTYEKFQEFLRQSKSSESQA